MQPLNLGEDYPPRLDAYDPAATSFYIDARLTKAPRSHIIYKSPHIGNMAFAECCGQKMIKLFLACDFRKEARAVKRLLKNKSVSALAEVRGDLIKNSHDYPDYLLRVLLNTVPALGRQIGDPEEFSIADDLIKSAEWEKYARDRQQAM